MVGGSPETIEHRIILIGSYGPILMNFRRVASAIEKTYNMSDKAVASYPEMEYFTTPQASMWSDG